MSFFNYYLLLQIKRANRYIREAGIHPLIIYTVLMAVFSFASLALLRQLEHGALIYAGMAIGVARIISLDESVLINWVSKGVFVWIRFFTKLALILPFVVFLIVFQGYWEIGLLLISVFFLSIVQVHPIVNSTVIPTPFGRRPFEFILGFRRSFPVLIVCFTLSCISVYVANFNLGLFALVVILLTLIGFYSFSEHNFYVWNFNGSAQRYLTQKLQFLMINTLALVAPLCLVLIIGYPEMYMIIVAVIVLGLLYIAEVMLIKYAYLHRGMDVLKGLLLAFSLLMPPLLLAIMPLMYIKALKNVTSTLWSE
ncbi:hypothetical protein N6H18_16880 [Reichenbachiella agarivorans]|uniref:UbiA prenyltransferase family protein n=1 Tax=Reichenbachiella agarivorans TaxID=2979464 RepID=A0ABY6CNC4_9BACT|nr:hypothetical protein [Reichenbachiella agarivorans]UXP32019.1 hypothetical protein N6H18_16880 [Reichenbachiella agarivorans]